MLQVLYSILDPDGKEGLDYNEFTALMMPPDMDDAYRETVSLSPKPWALQTLTLPHAPCTPEALTTLAVFTFNTELFDSKHVRAAGALGLRLPSIALAGWGAGAGGREAEKEQEA